ncbi:hypothetical protein [Rhizobium sp. Root483D2]|uniref:hypothetical protein n=1 Tax=Rhizobium sp. Root483D2 TaxID=1736545 RepID=UPI0007138FF7|nr:hypothetical protein [Rhizobium sp. Root483D2]KQY20793.1 hypothetical protein ASD32_05100 [Rhizobium sp. Root483D2]
MRYLSANNYAALQQRQLVARDFIWFKARTFATGAPFEYGFWSDVGNVSAAVENPDNAVEGGSVIRNFEGAGSLISISDIPLVSNAEAQSVTIALSQIDDAVTNLIRGYDLKQAVVEIYRGLFSPVSREVVAPALCRFNGFVDDPDITTPSENEEGSIILSCVSHTQEMTRTNSDTRSVDSQKLRSATDDFHRDAATVGEWELFWGLKSGKISTSAPERISSSIPSQR